MSGEPKWVGDDDEKRGEETEWDEGDPRVLFAMNFVLSTAFVAAAVYGLSYIDLVVFSVVNVVSVTLVLTAVMHFATN